MFGCICLKRKVLLVKGGSKHKRILKRAVRGSLVFYGTQGEDHQEEEEVEGERDGEDELKQKDRKKRKKVEYSEYQLCACLQDFILVLNRLMSPNTTESFSRLMQLSPTLTPTRNKSYF